MARFSLKAPPPPEARVLWVETTDQGLHFLDAVLMATDGLANVRREYREEGGRKLYKVFVCPQAVGEVVRLLRRAGEFVPVGEVRPSE